MIWVVHPRSGSRIRILSFYPSRIQGSKRHRIPDPDLQQCLYAEHTRKLVTFGLSVRENHSCVDSVSASIFIILM
jgi:hypothetical protein